MVMMLPLVACFHRLGSEVIDSLKFNAVLIDPTYDLAADVYLILRTTSPVVTGETAIPTRCNAHVLHPQNTWLFSKNKSSILNDSRDEDSDFRLIRYGILWYDSIVKCIIPYS